MYQQGIQQGNPDIASAIGVVLVIRVLIVALVNRRLTERRSDDRPGDRARAEHATVAGGGAGAGGAAAVRPKRSPTADGRAVHRRAGLPVPLLLHGRRLPAGVAQPHGGRRSAPRSRQPDPGQLRPDQRVAEPRPSLLNSGIFTGGVLLCTVVFGVLGGYALAMLHFRGRGVLFSAMLLVLVVPFQLSMIPLYVLIARDYGLGDTYLGMILPFAINSTAVFIFRQYLPATAARAVRRRPHRRRGRVAHPVADRAAARPAGPADRRAADVHRPVERVPLAVPDHQAAAPSSRSRSRWPTTSPPCPRGRPTRTGRSWPARSCSRCRPWCSS